MENLLSKEILKEEIIGPVTRSIAELNREPAPVVIKTNEYQPFMYEDNGKVVIFQQLSHDYIMRCPQCKIETKHTIRHLANNSNCNAISDINTFKSRFQMYKVSQNKERLLLKQRNRQKECDKKQKEKDIEQFKENQRNRLKRCDAKHKAENIEEFKENKRNHQKQCDAKNKAKKNEKFKENQRNC